MSRFPGLASAALGGLALAFLTYALLVVTQ